MSVSSRDLSILRHIKDYCVQIEEAVSRFGLDQDLFLHDDVYHNAVALCILQIGELVGIMSDEFRAVHTEIPWREIKLMRNIVAHHYGSVDHSITWDVVINDIPQLKQFCLDFISSDDAGK
ncbi:MAG: DUF86 domain-containing protein [Fretibacterium sp.]|nr:DUF86 domain-containing protein [Fretibacterium sp.]